jgi:hypothetical protein
LFVWWRGERSPDLSCQGDAKTETLSADADGIANELHIASGLRSHLIPMLPNEPRRPVPTPAPSPSPSLLSVRVTVFAL